MRRLKRREKIALGTVALVVLGIFVFVLLLTDTNWGRRHILAIGLNQLASKVHGHVTIGDIHGNLLSGARLDNVSITDTAGRPFLHADTLTLRYSLGSLIRQHLQLSDVHIINGLVVLDQPPGEEWNFSRIFPTGPPQPNRGPGFGSWILINNASVKNATFVVRATWSPPDSLRGRARQAAINNALSPTNRIWVVPVAGGYQSISEFYHVTGDFPIMRLADPDSANRLIDVARLSMIALPFRPPAAFVHSLGARVVITKDSLVMDSVRLLLPATRASGVAAYALNGGGARVQLNLPQVNFVDLRFLDPAAPAGSGSLALAFTSHNQRTHIIASNMNVQSEGAHARGRVDLQTGRNEFLVGPSDVTFSGVTTALIARYAPNAPIKAAGTLAGHVRLNGNSNAMRVDGDVAFDEARGPTSRITADGTVGQRDGTLVATGLRLRFNPLYLSLLRRYAPNVPYRGALTGVATLTGSSRSGFNMNADLVDIDPAAGRSHILASGRVEPRNGVTTRDLRLRFAPLQVAMLKEFAPTIPYGGTISGTTTLTGSTNNGFSVIGDITHKDPRFGTSHIGANGRIGLRNGVTADHLKLRFSPLQMALARPYVKDLPYGGTITGTTTLTGSQKSGFDVIADLVHDSKETGRSHVTANGWIAFVNGATMRNLRLGFEPLQVAMLRPFAPNLPIDGVLAGHATLSGSMAAKSIRSTVDIEHNGSTGLSHLIGQANMTWAGRGSFDVNLRAPVLSLATVGRFAPSAGLRGSANGTIVARGTMSNLSTDLNLAFGDSGGVMHTRGVFDLRAPNQSYDFTSTLTAFNAGAVTTHAPQTHLTGTVLARGSGMSAATANATINANLVGSRAAGTPLVDTALVRARLANGLATFEKGHIRLGSARADVTGSFGLIASQTGTLRYAFSVDTLSQFIAHVPADTGIVRPRPLLVARKVARAREDSVRIAQATEVQRAAVGYPPPPRIVKPDTVPFKRDTLAGKLSSTGTITGNVKRFDAKGTAQAQHFSYGATHVGAGNATFTLTGYGTPNATLHLDAFGDTVVFKGFAFDSTRAKIDYTGVRNRGAGNADIAMFQDSGRDYRAQSNFVLELDRKQVALQTLALRFDTTHWNSTHPATIGWGKAGVTVGNLELRSNTGGYLRADGRLPTNGSADLRLDIDKLQLGDVTALLQDTSSIQGILGLHANLKGTTTAPVMAGELTLMNGLYGGKKIPDVKGTLTYANRDLTTHFDLFDAATHLAVGDAHLPVNLALSGVTGPRIDRNAPIQADVRADSLPLESLPSFTTAVSDVRGRIRGNATIRGTFNNPQVNGIANLDLGSLRVVSSGVLYHDILGTVRFRGDTAYVDSIVAHAGGTIRTTGTIDLATLARPGFNLTVAAQDATLIDNYRGRINADADLTIKGPFDGVRIGGDALIRSGVIYAPETRNQHVTNLEDPTLLSSIDTAGLGLDVLPPPNPLLQNLVVDVGLRISPDTWARNTSVNVEIYTPDDADPIHVHMDNAHQVLTLTGVINTDRGEYTFAGRNFQLSTGSATFLGEPNLNPLLQLTARYQVQRKGLEALIIEVHVDGSLRQPRVTLQSNSQPPMSQSDLLSYLAFGQPTTSLLNMQSTGALGVGNGGLTGLPALAEQQIASVAIGASIESAVSEIEREGSRSGLDVFRVHAGELPAEAAFQGAFANFFRGTEIEAGKYVRPRLFVEARGRLSTLPGISLQYRGPLGVTWNGAYEPRYMPVEPSFSAVTAAQVRSLGVLLLWTRRY